VPPYKVGAKSDHKMPRVESHAEDDPFPAADRPPQLIAGDENKQPIDIPEEDEQE